MNPLLFLDLGIASRYGAESPTNPPVPLQDDAHLHHWSLRGFEGTVIVNQAVGLRGVGGQGDDVARSSQSRLFVASTLLNC
jgi:hypothetical protein